MNNYKWFPLMLMLVWVHGQMMAGNEHPLSQKGGAAGLSDTIDSVNLQNGNAVLKIPLGPAYDLGPIMSLQTHLYYNSKVWQTVDTGRWARILEGEIITKPTTSANAGIGFSVSPPGGKLFGLSGVYNGAPQSNNSNTTWLYVDADGGSHYLYEDQRQGQLNEGYYYSWDGSNIRAYISDSSKYVELANGVKITFFNAAEYHNVLPELRDEQVYWPNRIEDRFETPNVLALDYSPIDPVTGMFDVDVSDRHDRHWVFSFRRFQYDTGVLTGAVANQNYNVAFQILNIAMPGFNGNSVNYGFTYEDMNLGPTCTYKDYDEVNRPFRGIVGDFQVLKKLTLPDPDGDPLTNDSPSYEFQYYEWNKANYDECRHGVLSDIILPTRGRIHWDFELLRPQSFCAFRDGDSDLTDPWFPGRTPWIVKRQYWDPAELTGEWNYQYVFSFATPNSHNPLPYLGHLDEICGRNGNDGSIDRYYSNETITTRETDSLGNRHYYFFNNWDYNTDSFQTGHERAAPHAQNWTDYLLPYLKSTKIPFAHGFRGTEPSEFFLTPDFLDNENLICDGDEYGDCTTDEGGRYLSSVHFKYLGPVDGQCEANSDRYEYCAQGNMYRLERAEFVKFEVELNSLRGLGGVPPQGQTAEISPGSQVALPFAGDKRARLVKSRTVLYNNRNIDNWEIEEEFSDFDHFNNPKTTIIKETGVVAQEYELYVDYIDDIANDSAESNPDDRAPWIVGLYRYRWIQENEKRFKTETSFNRDTGLLKRRRYYADTSEDNTKQLSDILEIHEYGAYGKLLWTRNYGGDLQQGISTTQDIADINVAALVAEYETEFGYDSYDYLASATLHGRTEEDAVVSLRQFENEFDKNTGLLISRRNVSDVLTTYDYDFLGRPTSVDRSPDFGETYTYQYYPLESATNQYRKTVTDLPNGAKTTEIFIDGLGRDIRIETDLPNGTTSKVRHEYGENGYLKRSSMPYFTGVASLDWSTIDSRNFDGSPDRTIGPDGKSQYFSQLGLLLDEWSGPVAERKWQRTGFDFRGRIVSVTNRTTPCVPNPNCPDPCDPTCDADCDPLNAAYCPGSVPAQSLNLTPFKYAYDADGNLSNVSLFGTSLRSWDYDGRGFLSGESRFDKADVAGDGSALLRTQISYGGYDSLGNPGWMLEEQDPDGRWDEESERLTIYSYDPLGRLHTVETDITDGPQPGRTLVEETNYYWSNSADNLGKGKVESIKRVNYVTPEDNPVPVTITEIYTYAGGRGRMSKTTTAINQTQQGTGILLEQDYRYDGAGQLIGYDYPHFAEGVQAEREAQRSLTYSYDKNLLSDMEITLDGGAAESLFESGTNPKIQYHANGVAELTRWRNGTESYYELYHGTRLPGEIRVTGDTNYFNATPYAYDEAGNILRKGNRYYTYDSANRLISAELGGARRYYWYTKFGAIEKIDQESGGTRSNLLDLVGNYWGDFRMANAEYDPWGNQIHTPAPQAITEFYQYDGLDMPRKRTQEIKDAAGPEARVLEYRTQRYFYGPSQERFVMAPWKSNFEIEPGQHQTHAALITLRDNENRVVREYTLDFNPTRWKLKRDYVYVNSAGFYSYDYETEEASIHHQDELGNVIAVSDAFNGQLVDTIDYWPYGEELIATPGTEEFRHKFTGHERDFPDQDYMHARYYKPTWGRFLTLDPGPLELENPQTWNRYIYANNNPQRFVDPDGELAILILVGGGIIGGILLGADAANTPTSASDPLIPYSGMGNTLVGAGKGIMIAGSALNLLGASELDAPPESPCAGCGDRDGYENNPTDKPEREIPTREEMNKKTSAQRKKELSEERKHAEDQFVKTEEFRSKKGNSEIMQSNEKSKQAADQALKNQASSHKKEE